MATVLQASFIFLLLRPCGWKKQPPQRVFDTEGHCKLKETQRMHLLTPEKTAEQLTPRASDNDSLKWKMDLKLVAGPIFGKYSIEFSHVILFVYHSILINLFPSLPPHKCLCSLFSLLFLYFFGPLLFASLFLVVGKEIKALICEHFQRIHKQ